MYSTISKTLHTDRALESSFDLVDLAREGLTTASIDTIYTNNLFDRRIGKL